MFRKVFTNLILAISLLALAACEGNHRIIGGDPPQRLFITIKAPLGIGKDAPLLAGGQQARFTADVTGVNGPFNISWNFGGAAENAASTLSVQGTSTVDVELLRNSGEQTYTATATVVDGAGVSQSDSINFNVLGWHNDPPVIEDVTLSSSNLLTVTASDEDGDLLSFSLRYALNDDDLGPPDTVDGNVAVWDLSDELAPSPNDILAGGSFSFGGFIATVTDEFGASIESDQLGGSFEAFPLEDDTLYAIATKNRIKAGESVRIVIATGRTAQPFRYLNGVGVVCNTPASYVAGSLDYGSPDLDDNRYTPIDGIWADVGATSFLTWPLQFITATDIGNGLYRTDFSCIPLGGMDIQASGTLLSFEYSFPEPGTYTLGFEDINVVSRTYYQDSTAAEDFFWSDIENNHAYNTIIVE